MVDEKILLEKSFKNLAPIKKMSVSDWADTYLMLPSTSAEPGRFKTSRTPFMKEIMDAFTDENVHRVVAMTSSQVGKALDIETPIATPQGWKLMRDLEIGDCVFDERGEVCKVTGATEIMHGHKCFEIIFSDHSKIVCDAEHLWHVQDHIAGFGNLKEKILTAEEIAANFDFRLKRYFAIPTCKPLKFAKKNICDYSEELRRVQEAGNNLAEAAKIDEDSVGIPEEFLRLGLELRCRFLWGILERCRISPRKANIYKVTIKSKKFADSVMELLRGLGFAPQIFTKYWRGTFRRFEIFIPYKGDFFSVCRIAHLPFDEDEFSPERKITSIREVESRPVKCIAVDSPSHLYLAGRALIPTHNSTALNNVVGRFAHLDPCTVMLVQPTQEDAEKYSKTRIAPMIQDTKVLTPLFDTRNQTILEKYFVGGQLLMTGANSPSKLASQPVRIVLCDEVDRFPTNIPKEGDPVRIVAARTTTFWNYKIGLFSTPTVKNASRIEQEFNLGTQEYWSYKCPNCAEFHHLDFRNFVQQEGEIFFRCPDCGMDFTEMQIKSSEQKYIAKNPAALAKGIRSFWVNAFSSPWLIWKQIFQEWDEARGNPALEKVVFNTRFAETYEFVEQIADESVYLKRREYYPAELPPKVLLLTAAVDVQANRLEYEVVGWSRTGESFGVRRDIIQGSPNLPETWIALDEVLDKVYTFANGKGLKVARSFIDSGFATKKVYEYCASRQMKGRFAIKGKGSPGLPLLYQYSFPKGYGITLTILGVNDGKQEIFSRLSIKGGDCLMHFPHDDNFFVRRGYDEIYFKQLFSEKRVLKHSAGVAYFAFEPLHKGIRNESLDLAVYAWAACQSILSGKDAEKFFDQLEFDIHGSENIPPPPTVKKVKPKKIASRSLEIF